MTTTMSTINSGLIIAMPLAVSRLSRRLPVTDGMNAFILSLVTWGDHAADFVR